MASMSEEQLQAFQNLIDRSEIDDLLIRYATAVDTKDWDLWETCFTDDAFVDYESAGGIKGKRPEVRAWLEARRALGSEYAALGYLHVMLDDTN